MTDRTEDVIEHIDLATLRIKKMFQSVSNKLEERIKYLKAGEKICNITSLAAEIGKEFDASGPSIYPFVKYVVDGYPNVEQRRGKFGGIYLV